MTCPTCNQPYAKSTMCDKRRYVHGECAKCRYEFPRLTRLGLHLLIIGGMPLKAAASALGVSMKVAEYHYTIIRRRMAKEGIL